MLNMDMISRNGNDTLQLSGLKYNPDLAAILLEEAEKTELRNYPEGEDHFQQSDHFNFFRKGVSSINITTGLHTDYHKVSDDPASVDPAKAAKVAALVYRVARRIAGNDIRLKTVNP